MLFSFALLLSGARPLALRDLRCESVADPMNVDVLQPRLSWVLESDVPGARQSAYRIIVSDSMKQLDQNRGDLWDSGKVSSAETIQIPYLGSKLASAERVFWKVEVWDGFGVPSKWSTPSNWTMSLLSPNDWKAKWIGTGPSPSKPVTIFFRKDFKIEKPIKRAICFASGLGQYEMWLNGERVGKDWLTPGWTQYAKTILCDSYDVTSLLKQGANAAAIHVGNGMYDMSLDKRGGQQLNTLGPRKTICQILLEFRDGTLKTFGTDDTWRWSPSPESYSGVYGGEDWDARLEQQGWRLEGFDDKAWNPVVLAEKPTAILRGLTHANPPLRLIDIRQSMKNTEPKPNVLVLDLAQNSPYVPQVSVLGPAGTTIKMLPAERLNPDGTVDQQTMRSGKFASYTLRGGGLETWHPSFWYVGSQYWQIEATDPSGKPVEPMSVLRKFDGLLVHADVHQTSHFQCSNTLFNRIYKLIWWAMASNFASVISDCPHREKSGWLEQDHLVGEGLMYCFDMTTMFRKVVADMTDTQLPNGMVPTMAPEYFLYDGGFRDSDEWGGAFLLLPEMMQSWYGTRGLVAEHYDAMKRYVDYLGTQAKGNIVSNGLGDWNGGGTDPRTPVAITDTEYYFDLTRTLAHFAHSLGKTDDAAHYRALTEQIRQSFLAAFYNKQTAKVGTGSQSGQAVALDFEMIDKRDEQKAFGQLMADVEQHSYAVSCGEVGHPALLRVLSKFGRADVVARIHSQSDKPGYGYQLARGLTTLGESWDASPNSYDHFMLGHIMSWFYSDLAGIRPDPAGVAFSKIIIRPTLVSGVTWAMADYTSVRGRVLSSWKTKGDQFHLEVLIPPNTTATVYVPTKSASSIRMRTEGSAAFSVFVSRSPENGYEPIHLVSGSYIIDSLLP